MGRVLVTGGAGFIGSNICRALSAAQEVTALDNLTSGAADNLPAGIGLEKKSIMDSDLDFSGFDTVFHLAADPDVRSSADDPEKSFRANVEGTFNVLEACRRADVKSFVFTSTSTVYGVAETLPTPESSPERPISNYGASKVAGEAYASSYADTYGIKSVVLRYANIYGAPSTHGVMYDFYHKLKKDPSKLKILGNGKQSKSYLHVSDAVDASLIAWENSPGNCEVFNVGSPFQASVDEVAAGVASAMGLNPSFEYTGGEQGWKGDVSTMLLDVSKLEALGWTPKISLREGVEKYISWIAGGP